MLHHIILISIHEVFADLDDTLHPPTKLLAISIHEVFADLDHMTQSDP